MAFICAVRSDIRTIQVDAIVRIVEDGLSDRINDRSRIACSDLPAGYRYLAGARATNAAPDSRTRALWIIHTVGPIWNRGGSASHSLAQYYLRCIEESVRICARTLAFPAISTTADSRLERQAAAVTVATLRDLLSTAGSIWAVVLCAASAGYFSILKEALSERN